MTLAPHRLAVDGTGCTCGAPSPTPTDYLDTVEWFALHFHLTLWSTP